jgi:hypothetical protein
MADVAIVGNFGRKETAGRKAEIDRLLSSVLRMATEVEKLNPRTSAPGALRFGIRDAEGAFISSKGILELHEKAPSTLRAVVANAIPSIRDGKGPEDAA